MMVSPSSGPVQQTTLHQQGEGGNEEKAAAGEASNSMQQMMATMQQQMQLFMDQQQKTVSCRCSPCNSAGSISGSSARQRRLLITSHFLHTASSCRLQWPSTVRDLHCLFHPRTSPDQGLVRQAVYPCSIHALHASGTASCGRPSSGEDSER